MSIIPAKVKLPLYQGSTVDLTFTLYTDAAMTTPKDVTGYSAAATVRGDFDGPALLALTDGVVVSPAQSGLALGGAAGTIQLYVTDEDMAALAASSFTATTNPDGSVSYSGVWDMELTNPAGETSRYYMGPVTFSREVTHA